MSREIQGNPGQSVRRAMPHGVESVLGQAREFNAEDGYAFDRIGTANAVSWLFAVESPGRTSIADPGDGPVGYAALTPGFGLECMGRDGFVDDVCLQPEWRGRGPGGALLDRLVGEGRALGVRALHREVGREKHGARELYRRSGSEDHDRILIIRDLAD